MRRTLIAVALFAAVAASALVGAAGGARANGVPQLVKLTYLDGVSNWGPRDAEGVIEFSFAEAFTRIEVKNLKPTPGYVYEGWLTGGNGDPLFVSTIPVLDSGVGSVQTKLNGLNRYDYNLFVVTARPEATPAGKLPDQKSIAGRFIVIDDTTPGAVADVRPASLPDAGEAPPPSTFERAVKTLGVMAAVACVAFGTLLIYRRRHNHD